MKFILTTFDFDTFDKWMDDNIGKQYVDWDLNFKVNVIPATSTSLEQIEIVAEVDINTEEPDKLTLFALKWN